MYDSKPFFIIAEHADIIITMTPQTNDSNTAGAESYKRCSSCGGLALLYRA